MQPRLLGGVGRAVEKPALSRLANILMTQQEPFEIVSYNFLCFNIITLPDM